MGTITKALDLLTHFSAARPEIGLSQFVRLSGRDKATVHRHLTELEANGYLEQNPVSRAYRLGPALLRLAAVREAASPTRDLLRPIVADLAGRQPFPGRFGGPARFPPHGRQQRPFLQVHRRGHRRGAPHGIPEKRPSIQMLRHAITPTGKRLTPIPALDTFGKSGWRS